MNGSRLAPGSGNKKWRFQVDFAAPWQPVQCLPQIRGGACMFKQLGLRRLAALLAIAVGFCAGSARADDKPPITIGFTIEQTGGLAPVGKTGLLAFQIWAENINKKGGLLGRQVKLVY